MIVYIKLLNRKNSRERENIKSLEEKIKNKNLFFYSMVFCLFNINKRKYKNVL